MVKKNGNDIDPFHLSESLSSYGKIESSRKRLINSLFCGLGSFFLFSFGFNAYAEGLIGLAGFTLTSAILSLAVFIYQKITGDSEKAGYGVVYICVSLFLYLLVTGGYNNSGPLWCYALSVLILFVLGEKKGGVVNGLLIFYMVVAFIGDDSPLLATSYPQDFKLRFLATFIATLIMAVAYERSHTLSKRAMAGVGEQLYLVSRVDALTGLFNRRAMRELLEYESLRVSRVQKSYSVLFLDIDLFKRINDEFGHDCGDFILKKVAEILQSRLRNTDTVSRWGGEEFLVLLPETSNEYLSHIGNKLRKAIEEMEFIYKGKRIPATISVGCASHYEGDDIDEAINRADKNLYRAKEEGRNKVVV